MNEYHHGQLLLLLGFERFLWNVEVQEEAVYIQLTGSALSASYDGGVKKELTFRIYLAALRFLDNLVHVYLGGLLAFDQGCTLIIT